MIEIKVTEQNVHESYVRMNGMVERDTRGDFFRSTQYSCNCVLSVAIEKEVEVETVRVRNSACILFNNKRYKCVGDDPGAIIDSFDFAIDRATSGNDLIDRLKELGDFPLTIRLEEVE